MRLEVCCNDSAAGFFVAQIKRHAGRMKMAQRKCVDGFRVREEVVGRIDVRPGMRHQLQAFDICRFDRGEMRDGHGSRPELWPLRHVVEDRLAEVVDHLLLHVRNRSASECLKRRPHTGPGSIGLQLSLPGWNKSIEEHRLNARVIVEVFDVAKLWNRATDVHVKGWRTMRRDGRSETRCHGCSFKEAGEAFAARRIELDDIDCLCLKHSPEI